MKKLFLLFILCVFNTSFGQKPTAFFELSNLFLEKYVDENNQVDYPRLQKNADYLNIAIDYAAKVDLNNDSRVTLVDFSIMAYNWTG